MDGTLVLTGGPRSDLSPTRLFAAGAPTGLRDGG
jgi:hypothetical protein